MLTKVKDQIFNKTFNELRIEIYKLISKELQEQRSKLKTKLNTFETVEITNIQSLIESKYQKSMILKNHLQEIFIEFQVSTKLSLDEELLLSEIVILDIFYYGPLSIFLFKNLVDRNQQLQFKTINDLFSKYTLEERVLEIQVNSYSSIFIETLSGRDSLEYKFISNQHLEKIIINLINEANHLKKQNYSLNQSNPILDFELAFNSLRGSVIIPPVSSSPCLTIRFHPEDTYNLTKLQDTDMFNKAIQNFLEAIQKSGLSVAIAGTMSTGKTTLLSALLKEWNNKARKALIEDTREIDAKLDNLVQLQILTKKKQSNIQDLIKACKRHSIKYVALSEARDGDAWEIVQLAQNIYGCLMTYHFTVRDSIKKANHALNNLAYLCSLNKESPSIEEIKTQIASNIQILILLKQESQSEKRVIDSIHFINKTITNRITEFSTTEIFRHNFNGTFELVNKIPDLEKYFSEKGVSYKF